MTSSTSTPTSDTTLPEQDMPLQELRAHASEAVALLKLLGNEDRLMLLCQLAQEPRTVGELEALTGVGQPTLSQQLGILRRQGLVSTEREGKFIRYQIADERALQLMHSIHALFCAPHTAP